MFLRLLFVLVIILFPLTSVAGNFTLRDTLQYVLDNHPRIKSEQYGPKIDYLRQQSILGRADWNVNTEFSVEQSKREYQTFDQFGGSYTQVADEAYRVANASVSKNIWGLGGRFIMGQAVTKFSDNGDDYSARNNISINIALLKNIAGIQDRYRYEDQGFLVEMSKLGETENIENALEQVGHDYINWASGVKSVNTVIKYSQRLKQLGIEANSKGVSKRISTRIAWSLAEAARLQSYLQSISTSATTRLRQYTNIEASMLETPNINLSAVAKLTNLVDPDTLGTGSLRLIRLLKLLSERNSHTIKAYKNSTLPTLQFNLNRSVYGRGDNYSSSIRNDSEFSSSGFRFDFPLGNTRAKSNLKSSLIQLQRTQDRFDDRRLRISSTMSSLYGQLLELKNTMELSGTELAYAKEAMAFELKAYQESELDISIYLMALSQVYNQEQDYITTATLFQHLLITYMSTIDTLWDGEKISELL